MNLIRKGSSAFTKVVKSISITSKLLRETESREIVPSDDFRVFIPDVNFQTYLIENQKLKFIDGTVAYCDIKEINKIEVDELSIASLEGMQYFVALNYLVCNENQLTTLDVSKNTYLDFLQCSNNQLISLDVSKNTALTRLYCGKNQLTSLDVSKNCALTDLYCSYNQLTSLDLSKNVALTYLNCWENQLTLDLSKNPLLKKVIFDDNPGDWWERT